MLKNFVLALLLTPATLLAHDFWLEPATFHPQISEDVEVRLRVGQDFRGDSLPRNPSLLLRFEARVGKRVVAIPGIDGLDPAGVYHAASRAMTIVSYVSRGSIAEMTPDKFKQYTEQEGLEPLLAERFHKGTAGLPARDNFSRSAKALLYGAGSHAGFDAVLGLPLELIPLNDPYAARGSMSLRLRLLQHGQPMGGALVVAIPAEDPMHPVRSRSDDRGLITLALPRGGVWLVKAVRAVPSAIAPKADYDSDWASLIFELPKS